MTRQESQKRLHTDWVWRVTEQHLEGEQKTGPGHKALGHAQHQVQDRSDGHWPALFWLFGPSEC